MVTKERRFSPLPCDISLEGLVPKDDVYRRLEATLDLSFVRQLVWLMGGSLLVYATSSHLENTPMLRELYVEQPRVTSRSGSCSTSTLPVPTCRHQSSPFARLFSGHQDKLICLIS